MTTILVPTPDPSSSLSVASVAAYVASLIVKATGGNLYRLSGYNSNVAAQFIQVHNKASLPADAQVPLWIGSVPAASPFAFDFGQFGLACPTGIVVCSSSTGPTKTIGGAADVWFTAQYK